MKQRFILAITGASGIIYTRAFCKLMEEAGTELHGIISEAGRQVLSIESGLQPQDLPGVTQWFGIKEFTAPMASGSVPYDGMMVLPCTMGSLAAIAHGQSTNLIHRAADVMFKERRSVILAVRETPLNRNHMKNMLRAHDAGAHIVPLMPSFYHKPADLDEMARHMAGRLAEQLGMHIAGLKRWHG